MEKFSRLVTDNIALLLRVELNHMNGLPTLNYLINLRSKFTLTRVNMGSTFSLLHDSIRRLISILRVKCLLYAATIFTDLFGSSLGAATSCLDHLLRSHTGRCILLLILLLVALDLIQLLPALVLQSSTLRTRRYSKRALPESRLLTAKV